MRLQSLQLACSQNLKLQQLLPLLLLWPSVCIPFQEAAPASLVAPLLQLLPALPALAELLSLHLILGSNAFEVVHQLEKVHS
jgi:hypothetical protein